jgi:hypothetical protein
MFSVCGGKCLSPKAVLSWVEKLSQGRSKVEDDARPVEEVAETTAKRLLFCEFRRTGKAMGQVVEDMSRNKCFSQVRISYVLYPFVTYLLTLPRSLHVPPGSVTDFSTFDTHIHAKAG